MTAQACTTFPWPDAPPTLATLLERVTGELGTLGALVGEIQSGLAPVLSEGAPDRPETYRHAQALDLVSQTLAGLADVLALAARDRSSHQRLDVPALVADLKLADLANRLCGFKSTVHGNDLDLF